MGGGGDAGAHCRRDGEARYARGVAGNAVAGRGRESDRLDIAYPMGRRGREVRERPLLGYGPGTFAAEFVPNRLRAEMFWSRRLVNPQLNGFYAQAHCEYRQALAEAGIPAGLPPTPRSQRC